MTSLVPLASLALALAASAQTAVPSAAGLRAQAARAFASGVSVSKAVSEAQFAWVKAAAGQPGASAKERDSFAALAAALPLADKIQASGGAPDDVRHAAQLLGADETACLCLYGGGSCPPGLHPAGPGAAKGGSLARLPTGDQVGSWIASGAASFEQRQAEGLPGGAPGAGGAAAGRTAGKGRAARLAPESQLPSGFRTSAAPPPLQPVALSASDRRVNAVLSVFNLESFSRKDTLNRESKEGSKRRICGFLARANWNPAEAWSLSKSARDAKGADPGDLDLRNAEHYLYAYSTTLKPSGWGDSVPVQTLLAVGWTPFKTVTKWFRPTSTPSSDEMSWGVGGALDGWRKPDWKKDCAAAGYAKAQ